LPDAGKPRNYLSIMINKKIPDFTEEILILAQHGGPICGVDEAGRGPLAGPVVAAAVILNPQDIPAGLQDSKKLTEAKREALFPLIMEKAQVGVGIADAARIDRDNILQATLWAMEQAVLELTPAPTHCLIDGNRVPQGLSARATALIKGDGRSLSIAAASIIAKVTRDRMMRAYALDFPHYGFDIHKGYGTAAHLAALRAHGPCPIHRTSFGPVAALQLTN
jgi:ribonuclease HII